MNHSRSTRGSGYLEPFLARQRARQANKLIPDSLRQGRILDIGCGTYPYFLSHTSFKEKFAIDNHQGQNPPENIQLYQLDLQSNPYLPFSDCYFNVITMLAVIEHLNPTSLTILFSEAHRTLQAGGLVILTTPASWSDGILRFLAKLNFVSSDEINEHVFAYTLPLLGWYFGKAGFEMGKIQFGYFELIFNLWATATR